MTVGHVVDPAGVLRDSSDLAWAEAFLAFPMEHKPGTQFVYNSLATDMLSAILTEVTEDRLLDYLQPRLSGSKRFRLVVRLWLPPLAQPPQFIQGRWSEWAVYPGAS